VVSEHEKLKYLVALVSNPVFCTYIQAIRGRRDESIQCLLDWEVTDIGTAVTREQVIGEIRGFDFLENEIEQTLVSLQHSEKKGKKDEQQTETAL